MLWTPSKIYISTQQIRALSVVPIVIPGSFSAGGTGLLRRHSTAQHSTQISLCAPLALSGPKQAETIQILVPVWLSLTLNSPYQWRAGGITYPTRPHAAPISRVVRPPSSDTITRENVSLQKLWCLQVLATEGNVFESTLGICMLNGGVGSCYGLWHVDSSVMAENLANLYCAGGAESQQHIN